MVGRRRAEAVFRGNRWIKVSETPGGGGQMALKQRPELRPPPPRTKTKGLKGQFTPKSKTQISPLTRFAVYPPGLFMCEALRFGDISCRDMMKNSTSACLFKKIHKCYCEQLHVSSRKHRRETVCSCTRG